MAKETKKDTVLIVKLFSPDGTVTAFGPRQGLLSVGIDGVKITMNFGAKGRVISTLPYWIEEKRD